MPPQLVVALLEHRTKQDVERERAGDLWQEGRWVFAQPTCKPTDPRADYGEWKDVLRAAGVREARLHDARHTATTFLLVLGVAERAVMDVMGWSKITMTQRYQHVPDELRRGIAGQIGGLLWQTTDSGQSPA
jgi:integrase